MSKELSPITRSVSKFIKDFQGRDDHSFLYCCRCDNQSGTMTIELEDGEYMVKCSICSASEDNTELEFLITDTINQIIGAVIDLNKQGIRCSFPEEIEFTIKKYSFTIKIEEKTIEQYLIERHLEKKDEKEK